MPLDREGSDGWDRHTEFHWSRTLFGLRLDYWPTRKKFMYRGRVMKGDVWSLIKAEIARREAGDHAPRLPEGFA
jgi:hypothetical protein